MWIDDGMLNPGYGQLHQELAEAIRFTATYEGILLGLTYTGKAKAGLIQLVTSDHFTKEHHIVFIHTGCAPALFGYPLSLEIITTIRVL